MGWDLFFFLLLLLLFTSAWMSGAPLTVPGIPLIIFISTVTLREFRNKSRQDFISQLKSCRKELRSGSTVCINNMLLRYDSKITSYYLTVGALFTTVTIPSSYLADDGETRIDALCYVLISLLCGWWSINGPFATTRTLLQNIHGGQRTTVAALIDEAWLKKLGKASGQEKA